MGKKTDSNFDTIGNGATSEIDSDTESTSKRKRGRPRKNDNGGETETNIPRLVLVEEPEEKEITNESSIPKPSNKRKRKEIQYELKKEQISVLIKTTFDILGSREGMEIWKLSQQESELIAEPLSSILNKNPVIDKIASQYGEYIALCVALATIIFPRLLIQMKLKPKKEKVVHVKQPSQTKSDSRNETGKNGTGHTIINREPSVTGTITSKELYAIIPSIQ